jgi:hypothetical protein
MTFARSALMVVVAVALAAYGFDCPVTTTSDEAMQCCDTMACASHGHEHSEDCCKTMPSSHSPFVQTNSSHTAHVSFVLFAVLPVVSNSQGLDFSAHTLLTAHSHAPPISQSAVNAPLRI